MTEPFKYPSLPGASAPGEAAPGPAAKPAVPAAQPAAARPAAKPEKVLNTLGALSGAALPGPAQAKQPDPAKTPDATSPKRDVSSAQVKAHPGAKGAGGLADVRRVAKEIGERGREQFPSAPDEFAPGPNGGIARWDNLREQLRKEHRLNNDDPLFSLVKVLEEMELGLIVYLRQHRETSEDLIGSLMEAADLLDGVRDTQEQATNLLSELRPALDNRLMPMLENVLVALRQKAESKPTSEVAAPVAPRAPELPKRPGGWWMRLGKVLGAASE